MLFSIVIAMNVVGGKEGLVEACRFFMQEVDKLITNGVSEYVLYEACYIKTEISGREEIMNFDAVRIFSLKTGIIKKDCTISTDAIPEWPEAEAQKIVMSASHESFQAFLEERLAILTLLTK